VNARKVLVTAFAPWAEFRVNSSAIAAAPLDGQTLRGAQVKSVVLPVDGPKATAAIAQAIGSFAPDAVLALGMLSNGPAVWRVELIARNRDLARDGSGAETPIVAAGARILPTGLPVARIWRKLDEAKMPVEYSENAGGFVCNHVFYRLMQACAEMKAPPIAGFVHLPPPKEPIDDSGFPANRQDLEDGAWIVVDAVIGSDRFE